LKKQHGFDNVIHLELGMDFNEYIPENKLVYLTPTTFMNRDFILEIIKLNFEEFIANVVLDEVHCSFLK
jgi:superfamily II DNA helicase RecQ